MTYSDDLDKELVKKKGSNIIVFKRKVDMIGRVKLPIEIRTLLKLYNNCSIEYFIKEDSIVMKKYIASNDIYK